MATLTHVAEQLRIRPAHERYYDVADLIGPLTEEYRNLRLVKAAQTAIRVMGDESGNVSLGLPDVSEPVRLNAWSFEQLAKEVQTSARDLKKYPVDLTTQILQYQLQNSSGISRLDETDDLEMDADVAAMFGESTSTQMSDQSRELQILVGPHKDGGLQAKSVFSGTYGHYSPLKLVRDAMVAVEQGWRTPRAWAFGNNPFPLGHPQADRVATADDVMKCSIIKEGDKIGPAGVYRAGDGRNIFIFLASDIEVGPNLYRFVTIEDGEDRKLRAIFGCMNYSCGNHMLWGVCNVMKVEKKHRKGAVALFRDEFALALDLASKANGIPTGLLTAAKQKILGTSDEAISDEVFDWARKNASKNALMNNLTRGIIDAGLVARRQHEEDWAGADGNSVWAVAQGITRASQSVTRFGRHYADQRQGIDRAVGLLLDDCVREEDAPVSASISGTMIEGGLVLTDSSTDKPARKRRKGRSS